MVYHHEVARHQPHHSSGSMNSFGARFALKAAHKYAAKFAVHAGKRVGRALRDYKSGHHHAPNEHTAAAEVANQDATGNVVPQVVGGHKKVRNTKKKSVHVSSKFKKMVRKVEEAVKMHGSKIDIEYRVCPGISSFSQGYIQWLSANAQPTRPGLDWSFLPQYFLDAASCLWYGKAASLSYTIVDPTNLGDGVSPVNAGATAMSNVQFDILDSWETYLYKNETGRGCTLTIYECAPKKKSNLTTSANVWDTSAGLLNDYTSLQVPPTYWTNALTDESTEGRNIATVSPSFPGLDPTHCPAFNQAYEVSSHKVYLSPGASFSYKLQGPNNQSFSLTDLVVRTRIFDIAKYSRYVMNVVMWDLACTAGAPVSNTILGGRLAFGGVQSVGVVSSSVLPTPTQPVGTQLLFERKSFCKLAMPDMTGGTGVAAGTKFSLGFRRPAYLYSLWSSGTSDGTAVNVSGPTTVEPATGASRPL